MKPIFLLFAFFLTPNSAKAEQDEYSKCMRGSDADPCMAAAPQLNYQQKYPEALAAAKKACTLNIEFCDYQIYDLAKKVGANEANEAVSFFKDNCEKSARICDAASSVLEEEKRIPEALVAARKYYNEFKVGPLAFLAYNHGSKKEAFESSLAICKNGHWHCSLYLRYMPDHPQLEEILDYNRVNCQDSVGSSGATSCAIGGTFLFAKKRFKEAFGLWELDCHRKNMTSCQLILAGFKNDPDKIRAALSPMCEPMKDSINGNDHAFQKKFCTDVPLKSVSAELQKGSDLTLAGYLREQK